MTTARVSTGNCGFPPFGTRSVQLSERKNGLLTPKRHQIKHLEFVISWFGTRGVGGSNPLSPPTYLESISYQHTKSNLAVTLDGSMRYFASRFPFIINDLGATMIPWAKTRGSTV